MPRSSLAIAPTTLGVLLVLAADSPAQSTMPFWSSYFGGNARDEIVAIRRGPGNLITLAGWTLSTNLPTTSGVVQPGFGGFSDAFVARLDPSQPLGNQLVWCTYLGGSGLEIAFDAEVDPLTGITTLVGLTLSPNFPAPIPPGLTPNGPSDGFVAQIDASGVLIASMLLGSANHDRLLDVAIVAGSPVVTVAGVTEGALPSQWTGGTLHATPPGGPTDAFVARVDPSSQTVHWATYLGGNSSEGRTYASWSGFGNEWPGVLHRLALAVDPAGQPVVATVSVAAAVPPPTTGNLLQPNHGGGSDVYVAILDAAGTSLVYGSFLGGLLEDRPRAIALHPGGGFVVAGATFSPNFPTTPNPLQASHGGAGYTDGFVCYGDPSAFGSARRYCTYLGGNLGDDSVLALAVETSGRATLAGFTTGGNFPTTPRCHQDSFGNSTELGFVMRLELDGQGPDDLLYSTLLGGSTNVGDLRLNGLVLDDVGDVYVAGASGSVGYPLVNPIQTTPVGREGVFTHLPLLPGGVSRNGVSFARSACAAPLYLGAGSAPVPGATFAITATNAPPNGIGILVIGTPVPPTPLPPPFGCTLLASPTLLFTTLPSARGGDRFDVPVAATQPSVPSWGLAAQWFYFTTPTCPGAGMFACSERLDF